jgi:hypothetical protein
MDARSIRATVAALACAVALLVGTAGPAVAQDNQQNGLINVNLQDVAVQVPVSVAVPISVAANVCDVSILSLRLSGDTTCTAESSSMALSRAVADAVLGTDTPGNGGGPQNEQSGLINVNVQEVAVQIPASVALPISAAANVCGVSVASLRESGDTTCEATSTSNALSRALARAIFQANR